MPSPATRAHRALLAVLAAMAILTGLIPAALIRDRGLPVAATATHRRPDDDDDGDNDTDDADNGNSDDDDADTDDDDSDDDDSSDSDDDQVDEEKLPDSVKAILKKERKARRDAERKLKQATRKPAAKPKPKPKPAKDDDDQADEPSEREVKATRKLQRANLITALSRSKHGLVDPAAAAKLALQDGLADFDDEDEPTDVDDLVTELVDTYAFLKGAKPKPKPAPDIDSGDKPSKKAPKLTADQLEAAKAAGMTPERYSAFLHGGNLDDWEKLRKKDADKK